MMCYCMKMKIIMIAKRTINTKLKINALSDLHSLLQQQQQQQQQ